MQRPALRLSHDNRCLNQSIELSSGLPKVTQLIPRRGRCSPERLTCNHYALWLLLWATILPSVAASGLNVRTTDPCPRIFPLCHSLRRALLLKHQIFTEHLTCVSFIIHKLVAGSLHNFLKACHPLPSDPPFTSKSVL